MQDPTPYHQQIKPQQQQQPQFPEQEHLKCPRCDSSNTKFCYYNNYNLSQPRHFCKNCKRYWTKGGALRNIPVGGSTRKHTKKSSTPKRISSSIPASPAPPASPPPPAAATANLANSVSTVQFSKPVSNGGINGIGIFSPLDHQMLDISAGSFGSLLASNVPFGNMLLDGLNVNPNTNNQSNGGSIKEVHQFGEFMVENSEILSSNNHQHLHTALELQSNTNGGGGGNSESLLNGDWGGGDGGNVWPDLAIYTPDSNFQ